MAIFGLEDSFGAKLLPFVLEDIVEISGCQLSWKRVLKQMNAGCLNRQY